MITARQAVLLRRSGMSQESTPFGAETMGFAQGASVISGGLIVVLMRLFLLVASYPTP